MNFLERLKKGYNAFRDRDPTSDYEYYPGPGSSTRPDRVRFTLGNSKSIVAPIFTRIGIDVSAIPMRHVRLDENDRYLEGINSTLNDCLKVEANIDQSGRAFIQDVVMSACDEGVVAMVPVDTSGDPNTTGSYDILTMRTAKIVQWYPDRVRVSLYNDRSGMKEEITLPKRLVAIVENPLYAVMNEPNSTLQRLISKLNLLDVVDNQSGSGKLDIIIQLPYVIKTETKRQQAENRKKDIEEQLMNSKYGIAYVDATEKITQLNRPAENNLMSQIEYLSRMLFGQLGITQEIMDGTAEEKVLINYYNRTIDPFLAAISDAMTRTFLTKTARTQGQAIKYYRDPFRLVTAKDLGEIADSLNRNEILTGNELRAIIGHKPSKDPSADQLRNKNLNPDPAQASPEEKISERSVIDDDEKA